DMNVVKEQALDGFVDDDHAGKQKESSLDKGRKVFDFLVSVLVVGVGGLVGEAHGDQRNDCRDQIEAGMSGLRKETEAATRNADKDFERSHGHGCKHRIGGDRALFEVHGL